MMAFLKQIFTWWNKQTIGTFLYTLFTGKLVGKDEFGNKYFKNSKNKRWVIYNSTVESSTVPAEWHSWLHFLKNKPPISDVSKFVWQKKHEGNLTGTDKAYKPDGVLSSKTRKNMKKYETWKV